MSIAAARSGWCRIGFGMVAMFVIAAGTVRADRITLRGGGEVRGVIVPDAARPQLVVIQTETSAKPVVFQKEQVLKILRESSALDEYVTRRDQIPNSPVAQYEFGLWCEANKLSGPAEIHYQRAVELDKTYGPAHKKLGHVQRGDRWITYDELRESQGLVKYKGKWISRQEKDQIDLKAATTAEQSSWTRRLKLLRQKFLFGDETQRRQAETQLAEIRDPAAVPGLVQVFGGDPEAIRIRMAGILGGIPGPEAAHALLTLILGEAVIDVRQSMLDELARRRETDTIARFTRALRAADPIIVGRAAWALAALNSVASVPSLVPVLVKVERKIIMEPPGAGGLGDTPSYSFGGVTSTPIPPAAAANGITVAGSLPILTGPVMAPGAIAYGATSIPYAMGSAPGLALGGGISGAGSLKPQYRQVNIFYQNSDVLAALEKLTGMNFGFDTAAWSRWLKTSFRAESTPARRLPQP